MQRILVTGANGFVGQILCKSLQEAGQHVIALVGNSSSTPLCADQSVHCDIRDAEAVERAVIEAAPTHVVHLAAITHIPTSFNEPLLTWQTNVMGSVNLLQALHRHAPDAFVLFVSSSEVYGASFKLGIPLTEDTLCQPMNPYAASKLAAEAAFQEYFRQGMAGVVVRPFNHIGPGQSADFATASFARQIALIETHQQPPQLKVGNLQAARDFLDVRDVCTAYLKLLELPTRHKSYPRCFNICSGQPRKIQTVLDALLGLTEQRIEIVEDPERMRPSDISSASGNTDAIRLVTDWRPAFALEETLHDLLSDWRAQLSNN